MEVRDHVHDQAELSYWPGSAGLPRQLFSSTTNGLAALDAKTGAVIASFGDKGVIPN